MMRLERNDWIIYDIKIFPTIPTFQKQWENQGLYNALLISIKRGNFEMRDYEGCEV